MGQGGGFMLHIATQVIEGERFEIGIAETEEEKQEVYRLRFERYVEETKLYKLSDLEEVDAQNGFERDWYDARAIMVMVMYRGRLVATVRLSKFDEGTLLLGDDRNPEREFVFPETFALTGEKIIPENAIEASRWAARNILLPSGVLVLVSFMAVYGMALACRRLGREFIISDVDARAVASLEKMGISYVDLKGKTFMYRQLPVRRVVAKSSQDLRPFVFFKSK